MRNTILTAVTCGGAMAHNNGMNGSSNKAKGKAVQLRIVPPPPVPYSTKVTDKTVPTGYCTNRSSPLELGCKKDQE